MPLLSVSVVVDLDALGLVVVVEPLYAKLPSEAALLETAERDFRPRDRRRVHPRRPRFHPLSRIVGPLRVARPHRGAKPVDRVVRPVESFVHVLDHEDGESGSEALLPCHRRLVFDVDQKGRLVEVSPLQPFTLGAPPPCEELGSPLRGVLDHRFYLLPLLGVVERAHVGLWVEPGAEPYRLHLLHKLLRELAGYLLEEEQSLHRCARLTAVPEPPPSRSLHREVYVGVVADNHGV